jgi:copper chaperone CopZ
MVQYQIEVDGMSCRSCESLVQDRVTRLPGVASVNPNADDGQVLVRGDSGQGDRIRQAISEAGYDPLE